MLLRLESEGVDVDADRGHVGVVLVRLHLVEVAAFADLEAIVAVELEQGSHDRVATSHTFYASDGVTRLQHGAVPPIGEVEGLLALPGVDNSVIARHERIALDNPHELLARVVEVELQLVAGAGDGLSTSELQGLNQILVRHLRELAALISVEVDVIDIQRGGLEIGVGHTIADGVDVAKLGGDLPAEIADVVELQIDADLVVLEGDQRQGQTRVAAEPELERNVESVVRGAVADLVRGVGLTTSAVIIARLATLDEQIGEHGHVANHLGVAGLLTRLLGQLIPDVQPDAVVLVNALATDLELNTLDQIVTNPVEPAELGTRAVRGQQSYTRQGGLEVDAVD